MLSLHGVNIVVHVLAGSIGLLIGFFLLAREKGTAEHRLWGRRFAWVTLVVCLSAAIGSIFFRFLALFAVLNIVVVYQLVSGWRIVYTRENGPAAIDGVWTACGWAAAAALVPVLVKNPGTTPRVILYSTLAGLAVLLIYDTTRWAFPVHWHRRLWLYEHIYKIVSALFAMLSAMVGNVFRFGQPWSQIMPTVVGALVIGWFFATRLSQEKQVALRPAK